METQTVYTNRWKAFHDSLEDGIAKKYKEQIERVLGISQSAFYRKIKDPQKFLSIAEKQAIARVYNLKDVYLFPELAEEERIAVNG
jgi:ATP-dependent RNA circularization protein (DNA/RNA ligase family)